MQYSTSTLQENIRLVTHRGLVQTSFSPSHTTFRKLLTYRIFYSQLSLLFSASRVMTSGVCSSEFFCAEFLLHVYLWRCVKLINFSYLLSHFVQIWDFASAEKIKDVPEDMEHASQVWVRCRIFTARRTRNTCDDVNSALHALVCLSVDLYVCLSLSVRHYPMFCRKRLSALLCIQSRHPPEYFG